MSTPEIVEDIRLFGLEQYSVPDGTEIIGTIVLEKNSDGLVLPSTVRRIGRIELEWSTLVLPDSVAEVGELSIDFSDSLLEHAGVRRFGSVSLHQADFVFSEGVEKIEALDAVTSHVGLPSSLRTIGSINFRHAYDDHDWIDWSEGTLEVGCITMDGPTSIRVPASVVTIGEVTIGAGASLKVCHSTRFTGSCKVDDDGALTFYDPGGLPDGDTTYPSD